MRHRSSGRCSPRGLSYVTVVRIGYETERIAVASLEGRLHIEVTRAPIELPGLGVVGDSHCEVGRDGGPLAAALWAEAEKALVMPDAPEVASVTCQENGPWRAFLEQFDETAEVAVVFGRVFRAEEAPVGEEVLRASFSRWNVGVAAGRPGLPEGFERREMIAKSLPGLARAQRLSQGRLVTVTEDRQIIEAATDEEGRFVICAPLGALVELETPGIQGSPVMSVRALEAMTRVDLGVPD